MADIIKWFYPGQYPMFKYLIQFDEKLGQSLIQPDDSKEYKNILNKTLVCIPTEHLNRPTIQVNQAPSFRIREIIERVIELNCSLKTENVISFGYESTRDQGKSRSRVSNKTNIINKYPNSIVGYLNGLPWQQLHERIGDDLMMHLLKDLSLFIKAEKQCYIQLSGCPIYELKASVFDNKLLDHVIVTSKEDEEITVQEIAVKDKKKESAETAVVRKRKRGQFQDGVVKRFKNATGNVLRLSQVATGNKVTKRHAQSIAKSPTKSANLHISDRMLPRSVVMYSTNLSERFPHSHLLSSLSVNNRSAAKLIRRIFTERTSPVGNIPKGSVEMPQGASREKEANNTCNKKPERIAKRYVKMKPLFVDMLKRHKRCRFRALLKHHCHYDDFHQDDNLSPGDHPIVAQMDGLFDLKTGIGNQRDTSLLCKPVNGGAAIPNATEDDSERRNESHEGKVVRCDRNGEGIGHGDEDYEIVDGSEESVDHGNEGVDHGDKSVDPDDHGDGAVDNGDDDEDTEVVNDMTSQKKKGGKANIKVPGGQDTGTNQTKKGGKVNLHKALSDLGGNQDRASIPDTTICNLTMGNKGQKRTAEGQEAPCDQNGCVLPAVPGNGTSAAVIPDVIVQEAQWSDNAAKRMKRQDDKEYEDVGALTNEELSCVAGKCVTTPTDDTMCTTHDNGENRGCNKGISNMIERRVRTTDVEGAAPLVAPQGHTNVTDNQKTRSYHKVIRNDETKDVLEYYQHAARSITPYYQVTRFLTAVCNRVIPNQLWGSRQNKKAFLANLDKFVRLRKAEKFYLGQMTKGIKTTSCSWLHNTPPGSHAPVTESTKRLEVLHHWIWWLMRSYILIILRSFFYITESGSSKVLYYRKPVWKVIHNFGIQAVKDDVLKHIPKAESDALLSAPSSLGFSFMRFLPKSSSVRPITNLSRRKPPVSGSSSKKPTSINSKLKNLFEVLKFERARSSGDSDSALFGYDDLFRRLRGFVDSRRMRNDVRPLYFVHMDLSKCFDTILHSKLFGIIEKVLTEEEYLVRRFAVVKRGLGEQPRKVFKKHAAEPMDCRTFKQFAKDFIKEGNASNSVLVDQVNYVHEERDKLLALLREHIYNNLVKIGDKFYQQTTGIPQGSILSSLLCAYYYDNMERQYFPQVNQDKSSLLMRWVDDFLLITPNRSFADSFLATMHAGITDYGCQVNREKTLTNYVAVTGDRHPVNRVTAHALFPWCGILVDTVSLEVRIDFSRYQDGSIKDNIQSQLHFRPGQSLAFKMRHSVRPKCIPLLLSSDMNTRTTTLINVYHTFFLVACKFLCHCKDFPRGRRPNANPRFFSRVIMDLPSYFRSQAEWKCRKEHAHIDLNDDVITWLCCQAFIRCLKRKFLFASVVKLLRRRLRAVAFANPSLALSVFKDPFPVP